MKDRHDSVVPVAGCVPTMSCPLDFAPVQYVTRCLTQILSDLCSGQQTAVPVTRTWAQNGKQLHEGANKLTLTLRLTLSLIQGATIEIYHPRGLDFAEVRNMMQEIRGGTMNELPIEEFMKLWRDYLINRVSTYESKCLSVIVNERLPQQSTTIFRVRTSNYKSEKCIPPPKMTDTYLRRLLITIENEMVLR